MDIRALFWATLHDCVFKNYYSKAYFKRIQKIDSIVSAITLLASAGSVSTWVIWKKLPLVWSAIIMVAQTIQVIRPLLPYPKRIAAFNYVIPEYEKLTVEIGTAWHRAEANKDDVDYITMTNDFKMRRLAIEHKYLGADVIPRIERVQKEADQETDIYLSLFFNALSAEGGDDDAKKAHDATFRAKSDG